MNQSSPDPLDFSRLLALTDTAVMVDWEAARKGKVSGLAQQRFSNIVAEITKLRDYCLSDTHPRGRHKARVFRSRLGLTADDAGWLRQTLLDAAQNRPDDLQFAESDEFGMRYFLDVPMTTATGMATVRSGWIVLTGQDVLRLTSCYVL